MKKLLLLLTLIIILIHNKTKIQPINKYLDENKINIKIISTTNNKSLLINNTNLLVLTLIDENEIKNILNNLNIRKLYNLITDNDINIETYNKTNLTTNIKLDNISIKKDNNIIRIKGNNKQLCIYEVGINKNLNNCNFIWFLEIDDIDFDDNTEVVFYDHLITQKDIEQFYDKWVDSYKIEDKTNYEIIITQENYDIIDIDVTK